MKVKNEERIARLEAICDKMRAEEPDVQENALQAAILVNDEELAALIARIIRNRKLQESDVPVTIYIKLAIRRNGQLLLVISFHK